MERIKMQKRNDSGDGSYRHISSLVTAGTVLIDIFFVEKNVSFRTVPNDTMTPMTFPSPMTHDTQ